MSALADFLRSTFVNVVETNDCFLIGFKPASISFILKEVWNVTPLTKREAESFYIELSILGKKVGCCHFRLLAHGGYLAEALSFELHGLTISDESYLASLASGRHIELFSHNEAAYRAIETGFKKHRIGAVVQATGTGKSYLLARYILRHASERLLVIAPNVTILEEIKSVVGEKIEDISYRTFQSLVYYKKEKETGRKEWSLRADHILIDEFHHFGAEVWGKALQEIIESNPKARVLGTSATPIRPEGMVDTVDLYFEGNLFYELSLPKAWYYGILPVPLLVQSMYGLNERLDQLQRVLNRSSCSVIRRERIQRKLDAARVDFKTSLGASQLIKRFLPETVRKMLVFCRDKDDLKDMIPEVMGWLREAGRKAVAFEIHNGKSERENTQTLRDFRKKEANGPLHVLFSINMLIEGLHVDGVDAAVFLRRTESYIVTLQQLGRCLKAGSGERPVVLDFVNNLSGKSVYDVMSFDRERMALVSSPKGFEGVSDFQVTGFFSDIQRKVKEILAELEPWTIMWERLVEYRACENDWPGATEGKLGLWCYTQRQARKRRTLSKERIQKLDEIGFEWEQLESLWMRNYKKLVWFYRENGRWPKRGEGSLGTWCNTQRQNRKNGRLTKERIRCLDEVGFVWEYDREEEWQKNYDRLQTFYREKKRWPKVKDGALGSWCCTQRKLYRQKELPEERKIALDLIGFPWSTEAVWLEKYRELQIFYMINGRWPTSREGALGSWCAVQRRLYRNNELAEERKNKLEAIGFNLK